MPAIPPCIVSAHCVLRLKVALIAYHYYADTARTQTPQNMNYANVLRDFYTKWEVIIQQSKEDKPTVPVLSRNMTPVRWIESFKDCLFQTYEVRKFPFAYVIRDDANVPDQAEVPLLPGRSYSSLVGSILQEIINRYLHSHPLFCTDNNMVYSLLDEATRSPIYASTIKPYARTKDGSSAWMAIVGSYAGDDNWEQF